MTSTSSRWRSGAPVLAVLLVLVLVGAVVWAGGADVEVTDGDPAGDAVEGDVDLAGGGSGGPGEIGDGSVEDEVSIDAGDADDEPSTDAEGGIEPDGDDPLDGGGGVGDVAGADGEPVASSTRFDCLHGSGCGWSAEIGHLGAVHPWKVRPTGGGLLVVPGTEGVIAVDRDGERRWSRLALGSRRVSVAATDRVVLLATDDDLHALSPATGMGRWVQSVPEGWMLRDAHQSAEDASTIVASFVPRGDHRYHDPRTIVRGFGAEEGELRWEHRAARVLFGGDTIVLIDERVRAIDPATGDQRWYIDPGWSGGDGAAVQRELRGLTTYLAGESLLVLDGGRTDTVAGLVLIDTATGEEVARPEGDVVWRRGADTALDGASLVLRGEGSLAPLVGVGSDGREVWERRRDEDDPCCAQVSGTPEAVMLWSLDSDRSLLLDPADGSTLTEWDHAGFGRQMRAPLGPGTSLIYDLTREITTAVEVASNDALWRIESGAPYQVVPGLSLLVVGDELLGIPHDLDQV